MSTFAAHAQFTGALMSIVLLPNARISRALLARRLDAIVRLVLGV
jgi:hypothetical protein